MAEAKTVSSFKDSRIRVVHKSFPGSADQTVLVWTASLEVWCGVEPAGLADKLAAGCFLMPLWSRSCSAGWRDVASLSLFMNNR